jgi:addiction module RelE/StbE family toxin
VKIRYTRKALDQLDQLYSFIEGHNPAAADRVNARIKRSIERLSRFPYSGRESAYPGIRVLPVVTYPYLVFYAVEEQAREVRILRIRHGARDPLRHLD